MPSIADDRLMQQVRDLAGALDTVKALVPKRIYNLRTSREDVALSAQGSQASIPELVTAGADGYLNIDYERLAVFLIGAAKELAARQAEMQAASTATDVATLVSDFNALLEKLKTAGLMAS